MSPQQAAVEGYDKPLPLYRSTLPDGSDAACWPRCAASASSPRWSTPPTPDEIVKVNIDDRTPVRTIGFAIANYTEPFLHFDFLTLPLELGLRDRRWRR